MTPAAPQCGRRQTRRACKKNSGRKGERPMREILEIRVRITGEQRVQGCTGGAGMVLFGGTADSAFFHGVILPGGVDTQK